jgi:ABC-type dipeptide/oligopeptide/nickel transport systems, permease components
MAGELSADRRRLDPHVPGAGGADRAGRRLLRRRHRHGHLAPARRALGLSDLSAGDLALDRAHHHGFDIGPISITAGSLWLPIFIIGIVYIPYVARPIRGQVLALKESEFVLAAIGLGVPSHRILFRDILPNVMTTLSSSCR